MLTYLFGPAGAPQIFRFEVELVDQSECTVIIRFNAVGPEASDCTNHRPGTYGCTWAH